MEILSNLLPPDIASLETWLKYVNKFYLLAIALTVALSFLQYLISSELDSKRKIQLAKIDQQTSAANVKAEQSKEKTVELSILLEKEKTKRLEAEKNLIAEIEKTNKKMAPRVLSSKQKQTFTSFLSSTIKGKVDVSCSLGDDEAYAFAQEIDSLIKKSGWETTGVSRSVFRGSINGLLLVVKNEASAPPYAVVLRQAFYNIGIPVSGTHNNSYKEHQLGLIIGSKSNH